MARYGGGTVKIVKDPRELMSSPQRALEAAQDLDLQTNWPGLAMDARNHLVELHRQCALPVLVARELGEPVDVDLLQRMGEIRAWIGAACAVYRRLLAEETRQGRVPEILVEKYLHFWNGVHRMTRLIEELRVEIPTGELQELLDGLGPRRHGYWVSEDTVGALVEDGLLQW